MHPERRSVIERLYRAALAHAPEERPTFLADVCASDHVLRRQVEELLERSARVGAADAAAAPAASSNAGPSNDLTGRRLGVYHVGARLGVGGMGEVYRAHDTRLDRDVAIKVLPPAFTSSPDRLSRFEREARALAALNHPNIATIHGLEELAAAGSAPPGTALVMELVEGETLAERIRRGPLPVSEAIAVGRQIAEALEAAHEKGIVHRDLKPANIKVTPGGRVKVLDFGLAKLTDDAAGGALAGAPTVTATEAGAIVGTAAYMSPEQARGAPVDKRTDVWALACVFYEMLTGRRAFPGNDLAETLGALMHTEPAWDALPTGLPPVVGQFLRRCLQKDPAGRVRDVGDVRLALDGAFDVADPGTSTTGTQWLLPVAGAALLTTLVAGLAAWTLWPATPRTLARFAHVLPDGEYFGNSSHRVVAIAPDGSSIVFAGRDRLYRRPIGEIEAVPIRGTEGAPGAPFFSPDGQSLGYWDAAAQELRRISAAGGTPLSLARVAALYGASWQHEHVVYAQEDGIWRVPVNGGAPEQLVRSEPGELPYGPQMLAGTRLLFSVVRRAEMIGQSTGWDNARVVVQTIGTSERREIVRGSDARILPSGHLVYALGSVLFAIPFDTARADVRGGPVPVVEDIRRGVRGSSGQGGAAQFDVSQQGTLVYVPGTFYHYGQPRRLLAVDPTGKPTALIDDERDYWRPRVSPDGTRVAVEVLNPDQSVKIWIVDLARRTSSPLTLEGENVYVVWTPDSASVIYRSIRGGTVGLFRQAADGGGAAQLISPQLDTVRASDVSGDGVVAFMVGSPQDDIRTLDLRSGAISEFLATPAREQMAAFSPDGRWLAYTSNESGRDEVYVRPFPPSADTPRLVSLNGGAAPVWSPDGSTLYYCSASGELMAVSTTLAPRFSAGRPRPLFRWGGIFRMSGTATAYDMHPDGKRFIMVSEPATPAAPPPSQVNIVLNWTNELKRLVPVR